MDQSTQHPPLQESLAKHNGENGNFFVRLIDRKLNALTEKRIRQYTEQYAIKPDGSKDERLADHIKLELERRSAMGKELDIYEPIRWTVAQTALSVAAGVGIKHFTAAPVTRPALQLLTATTAIAAAIQAVRFYPRFDAGLKGGAQVALSMYDLDRGGDPVASYRPGLSHQGWAESVKTKQALPEASAQR